MSKRSKLPMGFGNSQKYGPQGGEHVAFWVGVIAIFLIIGAGMRNDNILLIAVGVVLALLFARQIKVWYTPRD